MAQGKPVTEKRAREIAHDVLGMHVKYPAPQGHGNMKAYVQRTKKHPASR